MPLTEKRPYTQIEMGRSTAAGRCLNTRCLCLFAYLVIEDNDLLDSCLCSDVAHYHQQGNNLEQDLDRHDCLLREANRTELYLGNREHAL